MGKKKTKHNTGTYRGKFLSEMTKDELIKNFTELGDMYNKLLKEGTRRYPNAPTMYDQLLKTGVLTPPQGISK